MLRLAPLALVIALAACSQETQVTPTAPVDTPPPATAPVDANALTANGWGPLRIGMTRAEVETALGPDANPNAVGGADPQACDQFRPQRAPENMLLMLEQGVLTRISLTRTSTLKTDRGLGIGDTAAAIKAAYGAAALTEPHKYQAAPSEYITAWSVGAPTAAQPYVQDPSARGIRYEVGDQGTVTAVHAGGPSIQLVEGRS
jgi:hypothetical protein